MPVRFGVLGPVEVWDGQRQLPVGGPQQRGLLAVLLLHANQVVATDRLIDQLWGDRPPATARGLLQGVVAGLRRTLREAGATDRLTSAAPGYRLRVAAGELDLDRFERLAGEAGRAETTDPGRAADLLADALALWRGPALDGIALPGCRVAAARLEERRLAVLEHRVELDLRLGRRAGLAGELRALVQDHPLRERFWAQLMTALHRAGQRADALAAYRALRQTLADELGVEPAGSVQRLYRAILADNDPLADPPSGAPGALAGGAVPAGALPGGAVSGAGESQVDQPAGGPEPAALAVPAQLPAAASAFTGRAPHLKQLDELLPAAGEGLRLVVVSGMAGVGKTTLAIHWGQSVRERFPDGQLYVNLRGYGPAAPAPAVEALAGFLQALGVPADRVPTEPDAAASLYRSMLADKRVLVVLDNAHDLDQVRPLLPGGDGCLVLVTSRDQLGGLVAIEGASHISLDVLDPAEARALLGRVLGEERVQAEPELAEELAELCGHLPLALRIAAAQLSLNPRLRIADQVRQLAAGDRLGRLAIDHDHTSAVRAAFDHSYTTLDPAARRLFRLLGLLPGTHTSARAAAALAGIDPGRAASLLARLARVHLVEQPDTDRYTVHDLVHLYAAGLARGEDTVAERRAATGRLYDWYLSTVDAAGALLYPETLRLPGAGEAAGERDGGAAGFDDHQAALTWLDGERSSLLAIVTHTAAAGPHPVAYRLADALQGFYWIRMYPVEWLAATQAGLAAARAAGDPHAEAGGEFGLGNVYMRQSQHERAIAHFQSALALGERCGWVELQCRAVSGLGVIYRRDWRMAEAIASFERALALGRQCGWLAGQAAGHANLGLVLGDIGELRPSVTHLVEALALYRRLGSRGKEALCLGILGFAYCLLGRLSEAEDHLTRSGELAEEVGDRSTALEAQIHLATVRREAGDYPRAVDLAQRVLAAATEIGDYGVEPATLITLGWTYLHLGRHRSARTHLERALQLVRDSGDRMRETLALIALAATLHGMGRLEAAGSAGELALSLARDGRDRVEEGNALATLAAIDLAAGRLAEAVSRAEQAAAIQRDTGHRLGEARALRELGRARRQRGEAAAAAASWRRAYALFRESGSAEAGTVAPTAGGDPADR